MLLEGAYQVRDYVFKLIQLLLHSKSIIAQPETSHGVSFLKLLHILVQDFFKAAILDRLLVAVLWVCQHTNGVCFGSNILLDDW